MMRSRLGKKGSNLFCASRQDRTIGGVADLGNAALRGRIEAAGAGFYQNAAGWNG
jgi:hypothetical protein